MTTKQCVSLFAPLVCLAACGAPVDEMPTDAPSEPVAETQEAFNPSIDRNAPKGHMRITLKAIQLLRDRGLLPPLLESNVNQDLVLYGNYFADHPEMGWPAPGWRPAATNTQMPTHMDSVVGAGLDHARSQGGFSFDFDWNGLNPSLNVTTTMAVRWLPGGNKPLPTGWNYAVGGITRHGSSVKTTTSLRFLSHILALPNEVIDISWERVEEPREYAMDNMYHYGHADIRDFDDPASGAMETSLRLYPFLKEHTSGGNDAASEKLVPRMVNQEIISGSDYGATKYGAILYQVARRFFSRDPRSHGEPDLNQLVKVGSDVPGWSTGYTRGHLELSEVNMTMPHTYLGGMPYVCSGSSSANPCATGRPTWPPWIKETIPSLSELEVARPGRSDRAGLIYLGWATHMIQDVSAPHHIANWTGFEHEAQDSLADFAPYFDDWSNVAVRVGCSNKPDLPTPQLCHDEFPYGKYWMDRYLAATLDTLLGPKGAPKPVQEICASVGIMQEKGPTSLDWQGVHPTFLKTARTAFQSRAEKLSTTGTDITRVDSQARFAGRSYVANAVLGTLKLLLCSMPENGGLPTGTALPRPRVSAGLGMSGNSQTLERGAYDAFWSGPHGLRAVGNDAISSVSVPDGFTVTLFEHVGQTGASLTLGPGGYKDLGAFNRRTSSLQVTQNGESGLFFIRSRRNYIEQGASSPGGWRGSIPNYERLYGHTRFLDVRDPEAEGSLAVIWGVDGQRQQWRYNSATRALTDTSGMCLDVQWANPNNGALVHMWNCNGTPAQQWELTPWGQIRNANGKCLDIMGADMTVGNRVHMWDCFEADHQTWEFVYAPRHDTCTTGGPLTFGSSLDVDHVCARDSFCCQWGWDGLCVAQLPTACLK